MSNYLAVATVTAILQRMLQVAAQADVDGVRVTAVQPRNIGNGIPETGINIFLYQVTRNPALNNADTASFRSKGNPVKRQTALDLYYTIGFYGNETELEPQRLLGSVTRTLLDYPILLPEVIQETIADPSFRFLNGSNLAHQLQQLQIIPIDLSLDDMSKIWSVFFQAPYVLSLVYKVAMVLIEGEESWRRALPVRDRILGSVVPFPSQPVVEQVMSEAGIQEPILADSTLIIRGKQLQGSLTQVRIGGFEVSPTTVSETQLVLPLTALPVDFLRAGVQGLQVIHRIQTDNAIVSSRNRTVESNVAPFVLRPRIERVSVSDRSGRGEDLRSATLNVRVDMRVGMKQRVILVMNEWSIDNPLAYQFEANPRNADTDTVAIALQAVKSGEYLLRLQIDGAESVLSIDTDRNSPTFNWYIAPKVRIE